MAGMATAMDTAMNTAMTTMIIVMMDITGLIGVIIIGIGVDQRIDLIIGGEKVWGSNFLSGAGI